MQGPIILNDNFTEETLKIYSKRFPNVKLILSTWDEYDSRLIKRIENIGVEVILNVKPDYYGFSNINLQIKSAKEGILKALNSESEYCLKTELEKYRHDFLLFLSISNLFSNNKSLNSSQRLITISKNTFKYRLYGVTDMLMFGHINDMVNYWDIDYDNRPVSEINLGKTVLDYSKANICEVYLCTKYLKKLNHDIKFNFKDYWQILAKYFCVVDSSSIDFFWYKYNRWDERPRYSNSERKLDEEFSFLDWINSVNELSQYSKKLKRSLIHSI